MTYAYYAVMGGFVAQVGHMHNTLNRVTITTDGLLLLAYHGHFLDISKDSIRDKSKADSLAKCLVCVQVLWMVGQMIERKITGYPITLLEVHTLVHVVCALVMFTLWFSKPMDVRDPTLIDPAEFQDMLAWLLLCTDHLNDAHGRRGDSEAYSLSWHGHLSYCYIDVPLSEADFHRTAKFDGSPQPQPLEMVELEMDPDGSPQIATYFRGRKTNSDDRRLYSAVPFYDGLPRASKVACRLVSGQALASGLGLSNPWPYFSGDGIKFAQPWWRIYKVTYALSLSEKDIRRLELAAKVVQKLPFPSKPISRDYRPFDPFHDLQDSFEFPVPLIQFHREPIGVEFEGSNPFGKRLLVLREPNFRDVLGLSKELTHFKYMHGSKGVLIATLVLIPTAYGSVHMGALTIAFPTSIERTMWKVACYILIGVAGGTAVLLVVVVLVFAMLRAYTRGRSVRGRNMRSRFSLKYRSVIWYLFNLLGMIGSVFKYVVYGLAFAVGLLYVGSRIYIVVESFISLRHVPIGVYQTPNISAMDYIPHL